MPYMQEAPAPFRAAFATGRPAISNSTASSADLTPAPPGGGPSSTRGPASARSVGTGKFLTGSLMRHVAVMTLTSSIGLLALFLVDFADLFFISQLGDPSLTAGIGFASTLLFLNSSLNIGLMITISALAARRIGMGRSETTRALLGEVLMLGVAMAALIALVFWIFAPQWVEMMGATGRARDAAVSYIRIVAPFGPITVVGMVCSGLLRAYGDARRAMNTTLAMAAGNAIFDPLLMFGLGWGFVGAAWATVISIVLMAVTGIVPILRHYGGFAMPTRESFAANLVDIRKIMVPAVLTNLATPVGGIIAFRLIAEYGEASVASYAVIGRIIPLAFCLLFSLSGSIGPIIGQNYGAGQLDRVRGTIDRAVLFAAGFTLLIWPALILGSDGIGWVFDLPAGGMDLIHAFAWIVVPLFFFNGLLFISNASFNNLDRANWSSWTNWGRNTLGVLPFAMVGSAVAGAPGVLIGQAIGGVLFGLGGYWLVRHRLAQLEKNIG
ncbi:MATE family efflux transporter [Blastomonas sp.]|uniref:MATE family efflux transporter n=2 Tax=Blastomonas TaxID=150203 RepID=UPI00258AE62B|nr:MATE family efflux transporter [Blastomonas sp.]